MTAQPQQTGAKAKLVIGFQTAVGQVAEAGFVMPYNTCGIVPNQALTEAQTITDSRNPQEPIRGNMDINGPVNIPVDSRAMFYWLRAMFGVPTTLGADAVAWVGGQARAAGYLAIPTVPNGRYYEVTTGGTTGATEPVWPTAAGATVSDGTVTWTCRAFRHTFLIPDEQPYLTIEMQYLRLATPVYFRFLDCKISSFDTELGGDGELVATLNVAGCSYEIATAPFDESPTPVTMARLQNFQGAIEENGAPARATSVGLRVDFDLDLGPEQYELGGQGFRGDIPEGVPKISGRTTALFRNTDRLSAARAGTVQSMQFKVSASDVSALHITLQELQYAVNGPRTEGPRGVKEEMEWSAFWAAGAVQSAIIVDLYNIDQHA